MITLGVVEDINDPQEMGRVRVRIPGTHNDSLKALPTSQLPWSAVMNDIKTQPGDWVVLGMLTDNGDAVIMGKVTTMSNIKYERFSGFYDPNAAFPTNIEPDHPAQDRVDYLKSESYLSKKFSRHVDIPIAKKQPLADTSAASRLAGSTATTIEGIVDLSGADGPTSWSMPSVESTNVPVYPDNDVKVSKTGHVIEMDDTPAHERISTFHKSGTYTEMQADGSKVNVIHGNNYTVVLKDDDVYVAGNCNVTIKGDSKLLVKGDYIVEVEGDYCLNVKGDINMHTNKVLTQSALNRMAVSANRNVSFSCSLMTQTSDFIAGFGTKNISSLLHFHAQPHRNREEPIFEPTTIPIPI